MSVWLCATPSQKRLTPGFCQSSSRWLTHQAGVTSGGPSPLTSYAIRLAPRGRKRISAAMDSSLAEADVHGRHAEDLLAAGFRGDDDDAAASLGVQRFD